MKSDKKFFDIDLISGKAMKQSIAEESEFEDYSAAWENFVQKLLKILFLFSSIYTSIRYIFKVKGYLVLFNIVLLGIIMRFLHHRKKSKIYLRFWIRNICINDNILALVIAIIQIVLIIAFDLCISV